MIVPFPTVPVIADVQERADALESASSFIVEAPAGSGKTGLLIQRFLKLLATVDEPGEVLALTFTTKATAEMAERVFRALRRAVSGIDAASEFEGLTLSLAHAVLDRDRERGWSLLERPHLLNIRTIDSLCATIVRAVPLTAGEMSGAKPVNDPKPLYQQAAHTVMMRFGGEDTVLNDAVETVLMHRDGDLAFCERVLAEMLSRRDQWGSLVPLGTRLTDEHLETVTLPRLNESLERTVCAALSEAREAFDDGVLNEICRIAERHAFEPGYKDAVNPLLVCAGRQGAPGCTLEDLQHWQALAKLLLTKDGFRAAFNINHVGTSLDKADAKRLKELLEEIACDELFRRVDSVRAFGDTSYPAEQWRVSKALFRLLEYALIELKLLFAREGVCDFTEVSLAARAALSAHEGNLQEMLGTRLRHMLVDEMQDTSAGQYDLLEQLTAGWDGRSQTVFLVGDPKQSIYLFRQARVDRFQQCMTSGRLGEIALNVLVLTTNFRSGAKLVGEFNDTFRSIFPESHPADGDVVFHEATAVNSPQAGEGMVWSVEAIPTVPNDLAENRRQRRGAVRREARATAGLLKRAWEHWEAAKAQRTANGDMGEVPFRAAVLTRARTHVIEIAKELEKAGLPYNSVDLKALAEQQEVLDVVAITRALLYPADRMAWMALLRAPWCGLELAHLHTLAAGDDSSHRKESLRLRLRERAELLPIGARVRVLQTLDVMDGALRHAGVEALVHRVERTWRSLGGDLYTTAVEQENVGEYLRVLHAMAMDGEAVTLANLNRRLGGLFAKAGRAPNAIDIMTIHRAKGLEWDLVILPGLHRQSARDAYAALEWIELPTRSPVDGSGDVLLAPLPGKGGEPGPLLEFIRVRKRERTYAEVKRLLYVAVTRARTSLHMFASPEQSTKNKTVTRMGTLLKAAWPAAEQFATVRESALVAEPEPEELQLAAAAEIIPFPGTVIARGVRLPDVERMPAGIDPVARLRATYCALSADTVAALPAFARPVGTFGARAVGNAIHAFIERLSREMAVRVANGETAAEGAYGLLGVVKEWMPAVRATLRSASLPPAVIDRATGTVMRALTNVLQSTEGRWILQPHRAAVDEGAWRTADERRVRLDRSFFAGASPGADGDDTFWIIDFKTGDRTGPNESEISREVFLRDERAKYEGQLRAYAEVRRATLPAGTPIALGLFYPLLDRLIWWRFDEDVAVAGDEPAATDAAGQFTLFG